MLLWHLFNIFIDSAYLPFNAWLINSLTSMSDVSFKVSVNCSNVTFFDNDNNKACLLLLLSKEILSLLKLFALLSSTLFLANLYVVLLNNEQLPLVISDLENMFA